MNNQNDVTKELIITVTTDSGKMDCSVINTFKIDVKDYIALMPQDADEIQLFCYKVLNGDTIELISIDNDKEFNKALEAFDSLMVNVEGESK